MISTEKELSHKLDQASELLDVALLFFVSGLAEMAAEQDTTSLDTKQSNAQKIALQMQQESSMITRRLKKGMHAIFSRLLEIKCDIDHELEQLITLAKDAADNPEHIFDAIANKNLYQITKISNQTVQKFYVTAKELFEHKNYVDAADAFYFLTVLASTSADAWLGLAHAEYARNNYQEALYAYNWAIERTPQEYAPYMFCAACYLALDNDESAYAALDQAAELIQKQLGSCELSQQIEKHKQRLKRRKKTRSSYEHR